MRTRAFSLVEVLVVVAVIGLLVALLLPALATSRLTALATVCLANNRSFGQGVTMYASDFSFYFPRSSHSTGSQQSSAGWLKCLVPYGVEQAMRLCPADPARSLRLSSYATNDHMEPLTPGIDYSPLTGQPLPGGRTRAYTRLSELPRPAATLYVAEAPGNGTIDHLHCVGWSSPAQVGAGIAVSRHLGGANYMYADGRATPILWPTLRDSFSTATSPFNPVTAR